MSSKTKYWKGLSELNNTSQFQQEKQDEFAEKLPVRDLLKDLDRPTGRRKFLKALGFGMGAVTVAACTKAPVRKAIPYLVKPEEVTPGVANYYASSINGTGILVKTQVGRPIKVEGNPHCSISKGSLDARAQATVLGLYDKSRLHVPKVGGTKTSWAEADKEVLRLLEETAGKNKQITLLTSPVISPSTQSVINNFLKKYPTARHVVDTPQSYSGISAAFDKNFGKEIVPQYRFDKADVIVSFDADFLGTWISPNEFARQYAQNRSQASLDVGKMSRHIQFESGLSLTGTNADVRVAIKKGLQGVALLTLLEALGGKEGEASTSLKAEHEKAYNVVQLVAKELTAAASRSLVVSGSHSVEEQMVVNEINALLQNHGQTIILNTPFTGGSLKRDRQRLKNDLLSGYPGLLITIDANPVYHSSADLTDLLLKVPNKIAFSTHEDETAKLADIVLPLSHHLESWGDAEFYKGYTTIVQPTINKVYQSRTISEALRAWLGDGARSDYEFVKSFWESELLKDTSLSFNDILQKGVLDKTSSLDVGQPNYVGGGDVYEKILGGYKSDTPSGDDVEMSLYFSVAIGDGAEANNPMLQELPDPVSKVTWDNYLAINPKTAEKLGIKEFELVKVSKGSLSVKLPALYQPGQAMNAVSVALGYGRTDAGLAGNNVGVNVYPFVEAIEGQSKFYTHVSLKKTGEEYLLAQTQTHHSLEARDIVRETSLNDFVENPKKACKNDGEKLHTYDLWEPYQQPSHRWVMAIDLNACTGCGACIVACNTENNVPVVGKQEVMNRREMQWIRVDRYYAFNDENNEEVTEEREMHRVEDYENVSVVHQPMLCQHCDHAPCETVCPVAATTHSLEGLNHMAYNRCVGTRYCANNCPYKVRRFNWFNYWNDERFDNYLNNEFYQLALNPDVTPRFRGVMEKCSFCIQRIQAGKLDAKKAGEKVKDGEIKTACQQTCPTNAIVFGDAHDENSEVYKLLNSDRTYYILEELNVQPSIGYMTKVRNI